MTMSFNPLNRGMVMLGADLTAAQAKVIQVSIPSIGAW